MKIIQFVLVPLFIVFVVLYFRKFRTLLFDRILVLVFGTTGVLLVMMPQWTARIAEWLGVGRGTDVILYFSIVGFMFVSFVFFTKLRNLEARLTDLARFEAMEHPRHVPSKSKGR